MDLTSGIGSPIGHALQPSSVIRAGRAAETHGDRMANGEPFHCPRGVRAAPIEPRQCAEWWRAKISPCLSENYGLCSIGAINDTKYPEDVMSTKYGKCANPDCPNKGRKMSLPAKGLCGVCYKKVLAGTMAWPPKAGQEETTATTADAEAPAAVSGQDQSFEKIVELPARQVEPQTAGVTAEAEGCRSDHTLPDSDLPENMDRPFSLGGFDFHPVPQRRMVGSHLAAITSKSLSLRTGVIHEHGLDRYTHARIAPSVDGKALAIKFYAEKRPGTCKIQHKRKSGAVVAMEPLTAKHPEWIGREAPLEPMGVGGWFLMRVGEAA